MDKKKKRGLAVILGALGLGGLAALIFGSKSAGAAGIDPSLTDPFGGVKPTKGEIDPFGGVKPKKGTVTDPDAPPPEIGPVLPVGPTVGPFFPVGPTTPTGPAWPQIYGDYPGGAKFYQVKYGDTFGGQNSKTSIAYRYLLNEGFAAAKEHGQDDAQATAFAKQVAGSPKRRLEVINAIQCGGWDDAAYGTYGYGVDSKPSAHGRAIRLVQQHAPNRQLLEAGQQPQRNIRLKTPKDAGKGNAYGGDTSWRELELLWLPGLDRKVLWTSGGTELDFSPVWEDGTSQQNPPPWVIALGMGDASGDLSGSFGCAGTDGELDVGG